MICFYTYFQLIDGKSSDARVSIFRQPTERPFFGSSSKYLFVEYTTTNQEAVPCLGWRLEYRFGMDIPWLIIYVT